MKCAVPDLPPPFSNAPVAFLDLRLNYHAFQDWKGVLRHLNTLSVCVHVPNHFDISRFQVRLTAFRIHFYLNALFSFSRIPP